ncbi:TPA: hypothetical protein DGT35_01895 [Patescibacteria group bacterium]|nr:hypothetical protein [Patescibacteria group bacterium]|tara:strand:+ start:98 stop:388 length:291 start_codon:yes stop_codon:yes gene_type:complete
MKQDNTNKLIGVLVIVLLALVYFLWQQNSDLKSQLEISLSTSQEPVTIIKRVIKAAAPKEKYKAPVKKQAPANNNQELKDLQNMLGDLMKLKEGLE